MTRDEMLMDFGAHPMGTKIIKRILLFTTHWETGSLNDLLRKSI